MAAASLSAAPDSITVNFHAGPGEPPLFDATGSLLAAGAQVRAGWLEPAFDLAANAWDPAAVGAAFHEFGRTEARTVFGQAGHFAGAVSGSGTAFAGKPITLWIVHTPYDEVAGPYSNIVAHALVTSSAANWIFPSPAALPPDNSTTLAFSETSQVVLGVSGGSGVANLRMVETGYGFATWVADAFPAGSGQSAAADDPDRDGLSNLVEFLAGSDPLAASAPPAAVGVEVENGQRWLVLTVLRDPLARGVTTAFEASDDLASWSQIFDVRITGDGVALLAQSGRVPVPNTAAGERRHLRAVLRTTP